MGHLASKGHLRGRFPSRFLERRLWSQLALAHQVCPVGRGNEGKRFAKKTQSAYRRLIAEIEHELSLPE